MEALQNLKGDERADARRELVATQMAAETKQIDAALDALNAAQGTRMYATDDGSGGAANTAANVVADPKGDLAKLAAGGSKLGAGVTGAAQATTVQVAAGLAKDANIGNKKVDLTANEKKQQVVRVGSSGGDSDGELPKEVVKSYISSKTGAIKACYQKGLQGNPDLAGKVKIKFLIQPTGAVIGAAIENSTLNDSAVDDCILNNVKVWHFPPAKGGGSTAVHYGFNFSH